MTGELTDKAEFADFIAKTSEFDDKSARDGAIRIWAMKNPQEMTDWLDTIDNSQDKTALQEKSGGIFEAIALQRSIKQDNRVN
jgi:hypothetical protein